MEKKKRTNGYEIADDVTHYLARELTENVRQLESGLFCVAAKSSLLGVPADLGLAESVVKHIVRQRKNITVDVGISMGTPHPMTEEHYIMWIELICQNNCYKRKFLKPGDEPKATFVVADTSGLSAREYCNIHYLWAGKE